MVSKTDLSMTSIGSGRVEVQTTRIDQVKTYIPHVVCSMFPPISVVCTPRKARLPTNAYSRFLGKQMELEFGRICPFPFASRPVSPALNQIWNHTAPGGWQTIGGYCVVCRDSTWCGVQLEQ